MRAREPLEVACGSGLAIPVGFVPARELERAYERACGGTPPTGAGPPWSRTGRPRRPRSARRRGSHSEGGRAAVRCEQATCWAHRLRVLGWRRGVLGQQGLPKGSCGRRRAWRRQSPGSEGPETHMALWGAPRRAEGPRRAWAGSDRRGPALPPPRAGSCGRPRRPPGRRPRPAPAGPGARTDASWGSPRGPGPRGRGGPRAKWTWPRAQRNRLGRRREPRRHRAQDRFRKGSKPGGPRPGDRHEGLRARRPVEGAPPSGGHLGRPALEERVRRGPQDPHLDRARMKGDIAEQALSAITVLQDTTVEHSRVRGLGRLHTVALPSGPRAGMYPLVTGRVQPRPKVLVRRASLRYVRTRGSLSGDGRPVSSLTR